jgi:putative DNA primase/helicase
MDIQMECKNCGQVRLANLDEMIRVLIDTCDNDSVYKVYKAWCVDNNQGYAKTAKDFRNELADYLGTTFSDMTVRRGKGGTFYSGYTLTDEAKATYQQAYGYDEFPLLSSS